MINQLFDECMWEKAMRLCKSTFAVPKAALTTVLCELSLELSIRYLTAN